MNYSDKLKDPRWQKKRLEIFQRDNFTCQSCGTTKVSLHVHHLKYTNHTNPWDYHDSDLLTLCKDCHELERDRKVYEEDILLFFKENKFLCQDLDFLQTFIIDHHKTFINDMRNYCIDKEMKDFDTWVKEQKEKQGINS